jgi:transposase-like protein
MNCPHCGNSNYRRSHTSHWSDNLQRLLGRQAYRCRECRKRFYDLSSAKLSGSKIKLDDRQRGSSYLSFRRRKRVLRKIIAVTVVVIMFTVFGLFLRHIAQDRPSAGSSQDSSDSSSE